MMKKMIIMLLAILMVFSTSVCVAETTKLPSPSQTFGLSIDLPEGATIEETVNDPSLLLIDISFADPKLSGCLITVAPSEEYAERSFADLSEDDIRMISDAATADMEDAVCETTTLEGGMPVIIINEQSAGLSARAMLTLHEGYFIQIICMSIDENGLTPESKDMEAALLNSLSFTAVE